MVGFYASNSPLTPWTFRSCNQEIYSKNGLGRAKNLIIFLVVSNTILLGLKNIGENNGFALRPKPKMPGTSNPMVASTNRLNNSRYFITSN